MSPTAPSARSVLADEMQPDRRYEVLCALGRGGSGTVYQVRDRLLDEVIALKVLDTRPDDPAEAVARCRREIKIARRLIHPNIAPTYELCVFRGRLAFSQALIDGTSLESRLLDGALDLPATHRYLRYLCSALDCAHRVGVVHGDFKPANVLIDGDDVPHIVDFGTALLVGASAPADGSSCGTPWYLSPEQILDPDNIDTRSDLYSLGLVMYRMLGGELPFPIGSVRQVRQAHISDPPTPLRQLQPSVPAAVESLVMRCLEKHPDDRPATASRLFDELERAIEGGHPPPRPRSRSKLGRTLVIDSSSSTRTELAEILRGLGADVIEAEDGCRGVELALAEPPQLIFVERAMPDVDGLDVLRILKANTVTAALPVVVTGAGDGSDEPLLTGEGAAYTLVRPLQPDVVDLIAHKLCAPAVERGEDDHEPTSAAPASGDLE